jgi:hypothetical protein
MIGWHRLGCGHQRVSGHRIQTNTGHEKQPRGRDNGGSPEAVQKLTDGLQVICQNKGWKVQQLVFVVWTCGSVDVESFNSNMKALRVLESKWDLIRRKLVRCLLEDQDKVLRSYFAQRGDEEEW